MEIITEDKDAEEVANAIRHAVFSNDVDSRNDGRIFVVSRDPCRDLSQKKPEALPRAR